MHTTKTTKSRLTCVVTGGELEDSAMSETCSVCGMVVRNLASHLKLNHPGHGGSCNLGFTSASPGSSAAVRARTPSSWKYVAARGESGAVSPKHGVKKKRLLGSVSTRAKVKHKNESFNQSLSMLSEMLNEEEAKKMINDDDESKSPETVNFRKTLSYEVKMYRYGFVKERSGLGSDGGYPGCYKRKRYKKCPFCKMNLDAFSNRDPWVESSEVIDHINNCKPPTPPPPTFEKLVVEKPLPLVSSAATAEAVLHAADSLKENPNNPMTTIHIKEEILEENVIVKKEPGVPENDVDDKTLLLHLQPQVILKEEPPFIKEEIL